MRTIVYARAVILAMAAGLPPWAESMPITRADQYAEDMPLAAETGIASQASGLVAGLARTPQASSERIISQDAPVARTDAQVFHAMGVALDPDQLALYRGGSATVNNDLKLSGIVANNSATDVVTGSNNIGGGSFSNATGLPMVIQNSGANVLIQNATIINVQMK